VAHYAGEPNLPLILDGLDSDIAALQLLSRKLITPADYFAVGDGIADDCAALIAAATEASTLGVPLLITAGTYRASVSVSWPDDLHVIASPGAHITGSLSAAAVLSVGSRTTIEGLKVSNTSGSGDICIDIGEDSETVKILRCTLTGGDVTQGISMAKPGIKDVLIEGNTFDNLLYGVLSNDMSATPTSMAYDLNDVRIVGNRFTNIYGDAIELNHPGAAAATLGTRSSASGFVITGNQITNTLGSGTNDGFGIGLAGVSDAVVSGNVIHASRREAIHVEDESYKVVISGNVIKSSGTSGIYVLPSCRDITITGNTVESATDDGILVEFDGSATHSQVVSITGNTVRSPGRDGITIAGNQGSTGGGFFTVTGNTVKDAIGNGITANGSGDSYTITGNTVDGCTAFGIALDLTGGGGTYAMLRRIRDNTVTNCGTDYAGTVNSGSGAGTGLPTLLWDRTRSVPTSAAASGGGFIAVPAFRVGAYMEGIVTLQAVKTSDGTARMQLTAKIWWDGTTFRYQQLNLSTNGGISSGGLPSIVDGKLTWSVYVVTDGPTVRASTTFEGVCLEDGVSRTGTVATSGLPVANGTSGTAAPASGNWKVGDKVWNSAPAEAGSASSKYVIVGWICTVAGNPGTWLQMRTLTGN
jgi:putative cofactor-binding repeat protein